jgi:hypothetical protein
MIKPDETDLSMSLVQNCEGLNQLSHVQNLQSRIIKHINIPKILA